MNNKRLLLPAVFLFGTHTLYAALSALYAYLGTDIVLQATLWFDAADLLVRYAEIFGSAMMLTFLSYFVYRHGFAHCKPIILLSLGALLYKYVSVIAVVSIAVGAIDLTGSLWLYAYSALLEIALGVLAIVLACKLIIPATEKRKADMEARKALGVRLDETDTLYPPKGLFRLANPINATLFWSVLALTLLHAVTFLFYFIGGAPLFAEDLPWLFGYLVLFAPIPGFLAYLIARKLFVLCGKKGV